MPTIPIVPATTQAAPFAITPSTVTEAKLIAAYAEWDGTGASGDFLPCLAIYSDAGVRLGRVFPSSPVTAGDSAVVTYAPFPGGLTPKTYVNPFGSSLLGTFAQGVGSPLNRFHSTIQWDNPPDVLIGSDIALDSDDTDVIINTAGWYSFMFAWQLTGLDNTSNGIVRMMFDTNNLAPFGWFGTLGSQQVDTAFIDGAVSTADQWGVLTTPAVNLGVMTSPPLIAPVGQLDAAYTGTAPAFGTFCNLVVLREA